MILTSFLGLKADACCAPGQGKNLLGLPTSPAGIPQSSKGGVVTRRPRSS
jgi:hypothetical protein